MQAFKAHYGPENCKGIEELVQTDYMDSEFSDIGDATREEWDGCKKKAGGGDAQKALEVRRRLWVSTKVHQSCSFGIIPECSLYFPLTASPYSSTSQKVPQGSRSKPWREDSSFPWS